MGGADRATRRGSNPPTLGDILFADGQPAPPESEWLALVRSIGERDQQALHALYDRTHRIVFTLIMRIVNDRQTAEELTLDVFHDVWRRAPEYDGVSGSVVGWVMNQARSRAIDRLRFEQRKKRVRPEVDDSLPRAGGARPDDSVALEEQARRMRGAMHRLSPQEREAIEATWFSGLTHVEAAARLGQPLGTIKARIRAGMKKLRQALEEEER